MSWGDIVGELCDMIWPKTAVRRSAICLASWGSNKHNIEYKILHTNTNTTYAVYKSKSVY